jgi:hypothetical protein
LGEGRTNDGWEYRIYWDKGDEKFKVTFTNEWKEVWVFEDIKVERVEGVYQVRLGRALVSRSRLSELLSAVAEEIAYRLEHDGSWIVRGTERVRREEAEMLRRVGLLPEVVPFKVIYKELPFGRTRLVFEKAVPVIPMALVREMRERAVERPPAPPKVAPPRRLGLTADSRRKLRVMYEHFLEETEIKPVRRLLTDFYVFLNTLEKKLLTLPEEDAYRQAKTEVVNFFKKTYLSYYGL